MSDGKNRISNGAEFDFMPIGQAIKKAREAKGITREQLAKQLDYAARHMQSIENEGQHPSFQLFTQLVTMFDISVILASFVVKYAGTVITAASIFSPIRCSASSFNFCSKIAERSVV